MIKHAIKDIRLAEAGKRKVEWAGREMQVLKLLRAEYSKTKPFKGLRICGCLHITTETANLGVVLKASGAEVSLCASNPLSTQDEVAAYLVKNEGIAVFAERGESEKKYYENLRSMLEKRPHLVIDDGADLIAGFHKDYGHASNLIGATEETTTGVIRLRNLARRKLLKFPVIAVNDAGTKHLFDNRYGTGQSTVDGVLRASNILLAGRNVVVCGYGWCGRGIAKRCAGMGAHVTVTEIDPLRALEAVMDGYPVAPMARAAADGDLFITATGDTSVISWPVIMKMKDGAMLANAGHFNVEIAVDDLEKKAAKRAIRPNLDEYTLPNKKRVYLLGEGRLVNLACAEGHPSSVMDMSFANQFLSLKYLADNRNLPPETYVVPEEIDKRVAALKLNAMGVGIDRLTKEQDEYLKSWNLGT